jgi:hypothetical protein
VRECQATTIARNEPNASNAACTKGNANSEAGMVVEIHKEAISTIPAKKPIIKGLLSMLKNRDIDLHP